MSKKKIAIVANNNLAYDSRVKRQAKVLEENGYEVKLFGRTKEPKTIRTKIEIAVIILEISLSFIKYYLGNRRF